MERLTVSSEKDKKELIALLEEAAEEIQNLYGTDTGLSDRLYCKATEIEKDSKPLHCKVGDTIYLVPSKANFALNVLNRMFENNRVCKQVVNEIRILKDDCMYVTYDGMFGMLQSSFGETWFLTEEEAGAKLEELRGDKHERG